MKDSVGNIIALLFNLPSAHSPPPREEAEEALRWGRAVVKNKSEQMCKLFMRVFVLDPLGSGST